MGNGLLSLSVTLLLFVNYWLCFISVRGECGSETEDWSNDDIEDLPISVSTHTGYCFVNECTIRIKESNVLLSIINKTADWIIATKIANLFTVPACHQ